MIRAALVGAVLGTLILLVVVALNVAVTALDVAGTSVEQAAQGMGVEVTEYREAAGAADQAFTVVWWAVPLAVIGAAAVYAVHVERR